MSIRFNIKRSVVSKGKIIIRRLVSEDWLLTSQEPDRYVDRGSINDPVGEVEDWGRIPSANLGASNA